MPGHDLRQSQNFLKHPAFVERLVAEAGLQASDTVVEIGPGKGIITEALARHAGRVIAVELDPALAASLRQRFGTHGTVETIQADFLSWRLPQTAYSVFANIPFDQTAAVLHKLLDAEQPPATAWLIMQLAAARKFAPRTGEPVTQAAVLLFPWFAASILKTINRREFHPVPHVDAALARFSRRAEPLVAPPERQLYRDFVIYGFNQWRPTLVEGYAGVFSTPQLDRLARQTGLAGLRPSEVSPQVWLEAFHLFAAQAPERGKRLVRGAEARQRAKQAHMHKQHRTRPGRTR